MVLYLIQEEPGKSVEFQKKNALMSGCRRSIKPDNHMLKATTLLLH